MTTPYFDATPEQAASLARDGVVERWVHIQADGFDIQQLSDGTLEAHYPNDRFAAIPVPHPPGTRARVREPWKSLAREDTKIEIVFYASGTAIYFCGDPINDGQNRYWGPWEYRDRRKEVLPEQEASTMPDWAIRMSAVCKSVTPEVRDGWGFVERWEKC